MFSNIVEEYEEEKLKFSVIQLYLRIIKKKTFRIVGILKNTFLGNIFSSFVNKECKTLII